MMFIVVYLIGAVIGFVFQYFFNIKMPAAYWLLGAYTGILAMIVERGI